MYRLAAFADEADKTLNGQIRAMKENGMNDGASRTVLRFHLCEDSLLRKLTVPKKSFASSSRTE